MNKDEPAFPVIKTRMELRSSSRDTHPWSDVSSSGGLTKRELFALHLSGSVLIANATLNSHHGLDNPPTLQQAIKTGIEMANALLDELSKDEK